MNTSTTSYISSIKICSHCEGAILTGNTSYGGAICWCEVKRPFEQPTQFDLFQKKKDSDIAILRRKIAEIETQLKKVHEELQLRECGK